MKTRTEAKRNFPQENKRNIAQLMEWVKDGELKPIVDEVFPLEKTAEGLKKLQDRSVMGKVLVEV